MSEDFEWGFAPYVCFIALMQVVAFVAQAYTGTVEYPERAVFSRDAALDGKIWTFITYAFLHASVMHLVGNVCTLVLVGMFLEFCDKGRVVGVWMLSVAVGALFHALETPVGLVGGSAGVYGLLAAHLVNLVLNWGSIGRRPGDPPQERDSYLYLILIILFAVPPIADYFTAPYWSMTSYSAHLGGAIGGLFGGFALLRDFHWKRIDSYYRGIGVLLGGITISAAAIVLYTRPN